MKISGFIVGIDPDGLFVGFDSTVMIFESGVAIAKTVPGNRIVRIPFGGFLKVLQCLLVLAVYRKIKPCAAQFFCDARLFLTESICPFGDGYARTLRFQIPHRLCGYGEIEILALLVQKGRHA